MWNGGFSGFTMDSLEGIPEYRGNTGINVLDVAEYSIQLCRYIRRIRKSLDDTWLHWATIHRTKVFAAIGYRFQLQAVLCSTRRNSSLKLQIKLIIALVPNKNLNPNVLDGPVLAKKPRITSDTSQ